MADSTLVIAKAAAAVSLTADSTDLVIGAANQAGSDITITEAKAGKSDRSHVVL